MSRFLQRFVFERVLHSHWDLSLKLTQFRSWKSEKPHSSPSSTHQKNSQLVTKIGSLRRVTWPCHRGKWPHLPRKWAWPNRRPAVARATLFCLKGCKSTCFYLPKDKWTLQWKGLNLRSRGRVLKIASFEGSGSLGLFKTAVFFFQECWEVNWNDDRNM